MNKKSDECQEKKSVVPYAEKIRKFFGNKYLSALCIFISGLLLCALLALLFSSIGGLSFEKYIYVFKYVYWLIGAPTGVAAVLTLAVPSRDDIFGLACGIYYGGLAIQLILNSLQLSEYAGFVCSILAVWLYTVKHPKD